MENKHFSTIVDDIYEVLKSAKQGGVVTDEGYQGFSERFTGLLRGRISPDIPESNLGSTPNRGKVRASNFGTDCDRELWFKVNTPDDGEDYSGSTLLKFLYGETLEQLLWLLLTRSGHKVEGEQTEIVVGGVPGHCDFIVDGLVVDCKSASPFSFTKFRNHLKSDDDAFGYIPQLGFYLAGLQDDPRVLYKNHAAFLVCDKVSGELCLDVHEYTDEQLESIRQEAARKAALVESGDVPDRAYTTVTDKKTKNEILGVKCSYCAFKFSCWPGLEVDVVSGKPKFVVKRGF